MVRVLRRNGTVTGYEAGAQRVGTEQVVELCFCCVQVLSLAGELICQTADDACIGNGHVAAPVKLGQSHTVGILRGIGNKGVSLADDSGLSLGVSAAALICLRISQERNIAVVTNGCPVQTILGADGLSSLEILGFTSGYIELASCPVTLVLVGLVTVLTGGDTGRIGEVEVRVRLEVLPCLLCSCQALCCICGIRSLVSLCCQCHRCTEISGCSGGDRGNDQLCGLILRHYKAREALAGYLVVNTAVVCLHLEHPVEFVLSLVKDCLVRICKICIQQVTDCLCTGYNVSAVVTGIVPAAGHVDLLVGAVDCCKRGVACRMAELAAGNSLAASLESQHLHAVIEQIGIRICGDLERITVLKTGAGNNILTGLLNRGEIALPVILTGAGVAHLCGELAGINNLLGRSIGNGELCLIGHAAEHSDLLRIRLVADLVGHDGSGLCTCDGLVRCTVIQALELNIVEVDSVCRQVCRIVLLKTAVEYELCHQVIVFLHGELVLYLLCGRANIQTIPDICLIGAAVLLDHTLDIALSRAGDLIGKTILCVLVQRDQTQTHLNCIVLVTNRLDVECELAAVSLERCIALGLLVHAPVAHAVVKVGREDFAGCSQCGQAGYRHRSGQHCDCSKTCCELSGHLLVHDDRFPLSKFEILRICDPRIIIFQRGIAHSAFGNFSISRFSVRCYHDFDKCGKFLTLAVILNKILSQ